jgi:hypothetical protein
LRPLFLLPYGRREAAHPKSVMATVAANTVIGLATRICVMKTRMSARNLPQRLRGPEKRIESTAIIMTEQDIENYYAL